MDGSAFTALLLADARVPTGAHAYSAGLEPAVIAGLRVNEVYPYMLARLATVTRLECGACVLAHRLATERAPEAAYVRLEQALDTRTPSAAQRHISRTLGRALLRLAQALGLTHGGVSALGVLETPPMRGTALGVLGSALEVSEQACAEVCCYEDLQSVAAAALKLLPVAPAAVTRWVLDADERVASVVSSAGRQ
jgi:urease accessory protein